MAKLAFGQMEKTLSQTQEAFTSLEDQDKQRLAAIDDLNRVVKEKNQQI
jgi:hypothetical protein